MKKCKFIEECQWLNIRCWNCTRSPKFKEFVDNFQPHRPPIWAGMKLVVHSQSEWYPRKRNKLGRFCK
jgi:hypothetical protein